MLNFNWPFQRNSWKLASGQLLFCTLIGHLCTQFVPHTLILILEAEYIEYNTDAGTDIQHNPVSTCIQHTQ